jgi:two-component system sensor histidine kinase/response regulator
LSDSHQNLATDSEDRQHPYGFEALANDNLRPGSIGAALTFCFLLLGQLASYPRAMSFPWAGVILATVALGIAARAAFSRGRRTGSTTGAHVAEAGVAIAALIHALSVMVANGSIDHTTHVLLLVIAAGCVMLSPVWLAVVLTTASIGWATVVLAVLPVDTHWNHFAYAFALAGLLSVVIFITRVRTVEQLEAARRGEHERRSEVETAMKKATSSEARFRQLLVATSDGFIIHRNGEILEVSDNAAKLLRTNGEKMKGQPLENYIERFSGYSLSDSESAKQLRLREGMARTSDGREIPIEFETRTIEFDGRGAEVISFRDATPHRKRLETLADQQAWERAILDSALDCIVSVDTEGKIVAWNRAAERTLGWRREEVMGELARDLIVPPVFRDAFDAELADYTKTGENRLLDRPLEGSALKRDGSEIPVEFGVSSTPGIASRIVTGYLRDVTEVREAEHELAKARDQAIRASTVKSEFLATMSHEIRTPMNGVLGMTSLLLNTEMNPVQKRHALAIEHSAKALLAIINDILDFSKIEAGRIELDRTTFDLPALVNEVDDLLREKARAKGLTLSCEVAEEVPAAVVGDPVRVRQVVTNLVDNAIKYTHEGQVALSVMLACDASDDQLVLLFEVRDSGQGVSPETQARLFTPFVQGDGSMTRKQGGTGLGLAICRRLVELMGGEIGLESRPNEGSTFWFTVQLEKGVNRAASAQDMLASRRVLLVSDHERSASIIAGYVRSWAMSCEVVTSTAAALASLDAAFAAAMSWDVVMVDHALEDNGGFGLVRTVRSDARHMRVPVVLVTALSGICTDDVSESSLVNEVITKPVSKSQLFDCLLQVMTMRLRANRDKVRPFEPSVSADEDIEDSSTDDRRAGLRVLIAEDNPINQEVAALMLDHLGHESKVVPNGIEALAALDQEEFDLILMDCQMPELDGFAAATRIRERKDEKRGIPIIAMTANAMKGDRERCLAAGMDDYIAKPIDPKELARTIARWQDQAARRDAAAARASRADQGAADGAVIELLQRHLQTTAEALASLARAVGAGDRNETRRLGESLRARGSEIGAWKLAELAGAITDPQKANPSVDLAAIEDEFRRVCCDLGVQALAS